MNFLLLEMTFLRYFMPLILEGNKRGIKSRVFVGKNNKYNNPHSFLEFLTSLSIETGFEMYGAEEIKKFEGPTFLIEGVGRERLDKTKHQSYSITYMTDFSLSYKNYIDEVDRVIFPSKYIAEHYEKDNSKNLYLGSPKYDIELDGTKICSKYKIPNSNNALVIAPKTRDLSASSLSLILQTLQECGFNTLVKSRGKDPMPKSCRGDAYFEDFSWYPHTSMELMKVSSLAINFGSTSAKELTMLGVPFINFDIKPQYRHGVDHGKHRLGFDFLYEKDHCITLKKTSTMSDFASSISGLAGKDWSDSFSKTRKKYLFEGNSSERILDYLEKS
jgi:hypothetical protein